MEEDREGQSLQRYLEIAIRWWWLFILIPILFGSLAYFYSKASERTVYQASSIIQIQESRGGTSDISRSRQLASTYKRLMTTRPLLETVATELGQRGIKDLGLPITADRIEEIVNVTSVFDTPLLKIEVKSGDPTFSVAVANTLPEVFEQDVQTKRLTSVVELQALAEARGFVLGQEVLEAEFSGLRGVTMVEPAEFADSSVEPSVVRNTLLGLALGMLAGGMLAFLIEFFNRSIKSVEQIERMFTVSNMKSSVIGVIYRWKPKEVDLRGLVVQRNPTSVYSEMFRQVRTGLSFALPPKEGSRSILLTSATPQEGKSTITTNLGVTLAQGNNRVILVESDLRRPSFHRILDGLTRPHEEEGQGGLTGLLCNEERAILPELIDVGVSGLKVLPAGSTPINPADLLGSERMSQIIQELQAECDFLLLDSPPILSAADPIILSKRVDGVVLVATFGQTNSDDLGDAVAQIHRSNTPLLGYILNKVGAKKIGYGRYRYHYYRYYTTKQEGLDEDETESKDSGLTSALKLIKSKLRRK